MAITEEIKKQIASHSTTGKHTEVFNYLVECHKKGLLTAQEIFDYSKAYAFTSMKDKPYVVSAANLNFLGVYVSKLEDKEQAKLSVPFFKLAAERNSDWGNFNYASKLLYGDKACDIKPSITEALVYIEKAVQLADGTSHQVKLKLLLCNILKANKQFVPAHTALVEYLEFILPVADKNPDELINKNNAETALKLYETTVDALDKKYDKLFKNDISTSTEVFQLELSQLKPLIECRISSSSYEARFEIMQQKAVFLYALYLENLDQYSEAMRYFSLVKNSNCIYYHQSIEGRARLVKHQVSQALPASSTSTTMPLEESDSENEIISKKNKPIVIPLSNDLSLPVNFNGVWIAETDWLHSIDENKLEKEYDKRTVQLDALIDAKSTEMTLIEECIKANKTESLTKKQQILKEERGKLNEASDQLKQNYKNYSADYRRRHRRYATEVTFFDPKRSKKRKELVDLTQQVIDQRYRPNNTDNKPVPIDLENKSTRQLITAERAYQEAIIALSKNSSSPCLGIPVVRSKPWTVGSGYSGTTDYGPVEEYKINQTIVTAEHRADPKRQRLGDTFMPQHGSYNSDIYPFFNGLAGGNPENEKKIAQLLIRYGKTHQGVTLEEIKVFSEEATENDVNKFNGFCFLILEKEQSQWHSATDESYQLGMAVSQARGLLMLQAGFLKLDEIFKNSVLFSIYSQTGIINKPQEVAKACEYIDSMYLKYLKSTKAKDLTSFWKKHVKTEEPNVLLTRQQAHRDLLDVYGGDNDTDDEGYETELSM